MVQGLSETAIPVRPAFAGVHARGAFTRALRFALDCGLGIAGVVLAAAAAHWLDWLLPFALLAFAAIVAAVGMRYGLWQSISVAVAAVLADSLFGLIGNDKPGLHQIANPSTLMALVALPLVALAAYRVSEQAKTRATEAKSWAEQIADLQEFTRRTLAMNLHVEPGQQLADLVQEIFGVQAVVIFDADLAETYLAG